MGTVPGHCHGFLGPHFAVDWFKVSHDPPLERMNGLRLPRGVTRSPSGIFAPLSVQLRNVSGSVATASSGVFAFTSAVKFSRRMFDCCYLSSFSRHRKREFALTKTSYQTNRYYHLVAQRRKTASAFFPQMVKSRART